MSVPEAPFDGEAHARKEGQWVLSYDKTALNTFVELVRSFYAGCKHYYDEIVKIVANVVEEAPVDEAPYVRQNKNWVKLKDFLGSGGSNVVDLEIINYDGTTDVVMIPAKHYFITPRIFDRYEIYNLRLILPPTSLRETKITVSPTWFTDPFTGLISSTIELHPSSSEEHTYVYTGEGQDSFAILPMKGTYHLVAIDGVWYIADAARPPKPPEQPS